MDNQNMIKNEIKGNELFENLDFTQLNDLTTNNSLTNEIANLSTNGISNKQTNLPTNGFNNLINGNANSLSNELINPLTNKCSSLNSDQSIDNTDFRTFLEQLSTDKMINNDDFENQLNLLPNQVKKDDEFKKAISELFFPKNENQTLEISNDCEKINIDNQDTMKKKYIQTYKLNNGKRSNNLVSSEVNNDHIQAANNLNTINMAMENNDNLIELKPNGLKRERINSKSTRQYRCQKYCCAIVGIFLILILWSIFGYITYEQIIKYHL